MSVPNEEEDILVSRMFKTSSLNAGSGGGTPTVGNTGNGQSGDDWSNTDI